MHELHPHDESHAYRFCPRCGRLEKRSLKPTEPERLVCPRCGFVFYIDPKIAVGTIIRSDGRAHRARAPRHRAGIRQVGVPRRLRRPRRAAHVGGDARSARGMRPRRSARRTGEHLLVRRPRAGHHRLRGHGRRRTLCADDECLEAAEFTTRTFRGTSWRSAARATRCETTWRGYCIRCLRSRCAYRRR